MPAAFRACVRLLTAVIPLFGLSLAAPVRAQTVYVTGFSNEFGKFDLASGIYTPIGTTTPFFPGIAFAPNGTLYGLDGNSDLYTIDPTTAATTRVGNTGIFGVGLTIRSDGTLFTIDGTNLYTINPVTAAATPVGPIGHPTGGTIEFDASDVLYEANTNATPNTLETLNQTTGNATRIGNTGFDFVFGSVTVNSILYGFTGDGDIIRLNTATGAGTLVRTFQFSPGDVITDAAVPFAQHAAAPAVPEPGSFALLAGVGTIGAGFLVRRRKQAQQAL